MTCNVRQFVMGLAVVGACVVSAARAHADVCGTPTVTTMVAGQHFNAGTVSISNDAHYIYVTYHTESPWMISEAHAAIAAITNLADAPAGIPQTKSGDPTPGRFSNSATFDPEVMSHTFVIPFETRQTLFVVAARRGPSTTRPGWSAEGVGVRDQLSRQQLGDVREPHGSVLRRRECLSGPSRDVWLSSPFDPSYRLLL